MRSADFSDAALLNGLVSQNEKTLRAFYVLYFERVRHFVLSNHGNDEDAKDLFQDVLLVLFQKVRDEHFKLTCALGTYMYSISRFLWLKELGKRKRISHRLIDYEEYVDTDADITLLTEKDERQLLYRKGIDKLSPGCRKVLTLVAAGYSITEITAMMDFSSEQHTKNRIYRCKLSLINSIKADYDYNTLSYGEDTNN